MLPHTVAGDAGDDDLATADDAHGYKRQKVHLGSTHSVLLLVQRL